MVEDSSVPVDYLVSSLVVPPPFQKSQSQKILRRPRKRLPSRKEKPLLRPVERVTAPPAFSTRAHWRATPNKTLGGRKALTLTNKQRSLQRQHLTHSKSLSSILLNTQLSVEHPSRASLFESPAGGQAYRQEGCVALTTRERRIPGNERGVAFLVSPGPDPLEPFVSINSQRLVR